MSLAIFFRCRQKHGLEFEFFGKTKLVKDKITKFF